MGSAGRPRLDAVEGWRRCFTPQSGDQPQGLDDDSLGDLRLSVFALAEGDGDLADREPGLPGSQHELDLEPVAVGSDRLGQQRRQHLAPIHPVAARCIPQRKPEREPRVGVAGPRQPQPGAAPVRDRAPRARSGCRSRGRDRRRRPAARRAPRDRATGPSPSPRSGRSPRRSRREIRAGTRSPDPPSPGAPRAGPGARATRSRGRARPFRPASRRPPPRRRATPGAPGSPRRPSRSCRARCRWAGRRAFERRSAAEAGPREPAARRRGVAAIARANAIESHGTQSPRREYGVRTVEARTSDSRTAGRNSPASAVTPPRGIDDRRDPGDRGVDHPAPLLHRPEPAQQHVLARGGRLLVGRVVRQDHEQLGPLAHQGPVDSGEAVLVAHRRRRSGGARRRTADEPVRRA